MRVQGKTQATSGRRAQITPTVMHPVIRVHVTPGQQVKAGDTLVELDRHEPEAEVRARQAEVEVKRAGLAKLEATPRAELQDKARAELQHAEVTRRAAAQYVARLESPHKQGAISERQYIDAQTALSEAEKAETAAEAHLQYVLKQPFSHEISELTAHVAAAQAELETAEAELEHYTIVAPIDGIVAWLNVFPGTVTRPGTAVWGEILDLVEIDVRAEVTFAQLRRLTPQSEVQIVVDGWPERTWQARLVVLGNAAHPATGLIPITARIADAAGEIPSDVPVALSIGY